MGVSQRRKMSQVQDVFWSFCPLGAASAVLGLWTYPLHPTKKSVCHLWPAVLNSVVYLAAYISTGDEYSASGTISRSDTNKEADNYIYRVIFLLPLMSLFVLAIQRPKVRSILQKLQFLDGICVDLEVNQALRKVSWTIVGVSLANSLATTFSDGYFVWSEYQVAGLATALAGFHFVSIRNVAAGQLLFFATAIGRRFQHVCDEMGTTCTALQELFRASEPEEEEEEAKHIRKITFAKSGKVFLQLHELIEDVNKAFGLSTCFIYISVGLEFAMQAFFAIDNWSNLPTVQKILSLACVTSYALTTAFYTSAMHRNAEISTQPLKHLLKIRKLNLSQDCQEQVQTLIRRMSGPPVQYTAANYFTISNGLITSIAASVTTYLVILVQFRSSESNSCNCSYPTP